MTRMGIEKRIKNLLLLIYLIHISNLKAHLENPLKLQKLVFLSQKELSEKKMRAFNYTFFRWLKGPFSADLSNDLNLLKQIKYIIWDENIYLTEEGKYILENCREIFQMNKDFLSVIEESIDNYLTLEPDDIKEMVYDIKIRVPIRNEILPIKEIPQGTPIQFGLSNKNTKRDFFLTEGWATTLELIFDEEAMEWLGKAQKDALEGKICETK
jgi:uncharacterized protein YwgA